MNVFFLKLIAIITMITDHYGAVFQSSDITYRLVGRLAFPIYAFLIVEGFIHTRDIKRYGRRLLIFAFISELPFDYAFFGGLNWTHQNIFFTLFLGLITLYFLDRGKEKSFSNKYLTITGLGFLSSLLMFDYGIIGIVYISAFYLTRGLDKNKKFLTLAAVMFLTNLLMSNSLQQYSLLALVTLYFYNGKLGVKNKIVQILFYLLYPIHLMVFAILR